VRDLTIAPGPYGVRESRSGAIHAAAAGGCGKVVRAQEAERAESLGFPAAVIEEPEAPVRPKASRGYHCRAASPACEPSAPAGGEGRPRLAARLSQPCSRCCLARLGQSFPLPKQSLAPSPGPRPRKRLRLIPLPSNRELRPPPAGLTVPDRCSRDIVEPGGLVSLSPGVGRLIPETPPDSPLSYDHVRSPDLR